jgi:2-methylisocitrate lyase-like PEP mutase family enzyme
MTSQQDKPSHADRARRFLELHRGDTALLMPNPWDIGSARILESLGFEALATTSSGFAGTLGRLDGSVTADEALAHAADLAGAVTVPVSADLENAFADDPAGVAHTITGAVAAGLAGCSVEDYSRERGLYAPELAAERVVAAAEAAHHGDVHLVLTARAENHIRGNPDLADTIARLQSFQEAGADALFAPGVSDADDIRQIVAAVDLPVSVLALPNTPPVAELSKIGVKRISVGGSFFYAAVAGMAKAAQELLEQGTYGYWSEVGAGNGVARAAFSA